MKSNVSHPSEIWHNRSDRLCQICRVALTGGIACGKSLAAKFLNEFGVETIDADDIVHELVPEDERRRLAKIVFNDSAARKVLEARLHPLVRSRIDAFLGSGGHAGRVPLPEAEGASCCGGHAGRVPLPEAEGLSFSCGHAGRVPLPDAEGVSCSGGHAGRVPLPEAEGASCSGGHAGRVPLPEADIHSSTSPLTHSSTSPLPHSPTPPLTHSPTPPLPHSPTPPLRLAVIPLLFEVQWDTDFDIICCVASERENQIRRMTTTRGYTREEAEARLAAQLPVEEKAAKSHYVIRNDGTADELREEVARFVAFLGERTA